MRTPVSKFVLLVVFNECPEATTPLFPLNVNFEQLCEIAIKRLPLEISNYVLYLVPSVVS
jgi:hypothetical protein